MRIKSAFILGIMAFAFCAAPLFGQATFTVAASQMAGADIGVTELAGGILLTVDSGTSVASTFIVQYSAPITNNGASEIVVVGAAGPARLNRNNNTVAIDVPAGLAPGNWIRMVGVRVSVAAVGTSVTATITGTDPAGNAILSGQNTVTVIDPVMQPFSVTLGNPITWAGGTFTNAVTTILVSQNYILPFANSAGFYGQTGPAQLRFTPYVSIPPGTTITFPASVASPESGASFTTVSGVAETIPRSDGSTSVVYNYTIAPASSFNLETFNFVPTGTIQSPATTGTLTFQVTLLPIDSPNSTDIPRYVERFVPDETDLTSGFSQLAFPFAAQSQASYTGIAITNPINSKIKLTLTAYDANGTSISGTGITNPVTVTMPRKGQFAKLASEVFGPNFNLGPGTILATANTALMPGFYLQGAIAGQGLDGTTADVKAVRSWIWPSVIHDDPSSFTVFRMFNPAAPGGSQVTASLQLVDSGGNPIAAATQFIPASGTATKRLDELFAGINLNSFKGGYVTGSSDGDLVVSEMFGNALDFAILQGQQPIQSTSFMIAHFASGGGYSTELNIVNTSTTAPANITLTLLDNSGNVIGNPLTLTIASKAQLIKTLDQLFPSLGSALITGYIRVDIQPYYIGPFPTTAALTGAFRFTSANGSGSAALPLSMPFVQSFVYSHVAQDLGYFTGITIVNPNSTIATVNLQVTTKDGASVGTKTIYLQPGQKIAQLLYQWVGASLGQVGGYVSIQSDQPVLSFSLFGTSDGKVLSAIPPQRTDQ